MLRPTFAAPILAALLLSVATLVAGCGAGAGASAPRVPPTATADTLADYARVGARLTDALVAAQEDVYAAGSGATGSAKMTAVNAVIRDMRALRPPPGQEEAGRSWTLMVDNYDKWSTEYEVFNRIGYTSATPDLLKRAGAYLDEGLKYENQWRAAVKAPAPARTATPVVTPAPAVTKMPPGTTATLDLNGRDEVPLADQLKDLLAYGPASSSERAWAVSTRKVILVPKGAAVTVLEIQGDYAHVRVQDGPWRNSDGWVDRRAVPSVGQ